MGVSLYRELMQRIIPEHRPLWWLALFGYLQIPLNTWYGASLVGSKTLNCNILRVFQCPIL